LVENHLTERHYAIAKLLAKKQLIETQFAYAVKQSYNE